jgi:hypothetical protein
VEKLSVVDLFSVLLYAAQLEDIDVREEKSGINEGELVEN